jgi:hypothetical protein
MKNINKKIEGIGGLLLIPFFGMIFSLITMVNLLVSEIFKYIYYYNWKLIFSSSENLKAFIIVILYFYYNIFVIVFMVILMLLISQKEYYFPILYIIFLVSVFLISGLIYLISNEIEFKNEFGRSFISMVIWGLYFLKSKRVKNTFVKTKCLN